MTDVDGTSEAAGGVRALGSIVLGRPERAQRSEWLRGGLVVVRSRNGLREPEQLLIEAIPARAPRLWCVGDAEGVVALACRCVLPSAAVAHIAFDAYEAGRVRRTCRRNGGGVEVVLGADLPGAGPEPCETGDGAAAVLMVAPADALLVRELVEQAHDRLALGGRLLLAAQGPPKRTLRMVKEVFGSADRQAGSRRGALLVSARRTRSTTAWRDRTRVVRREVRGLTLELEVRPGVFGQKGLDAGTRALLEQLAVSPDTRVLDLGCGAGALGIAAALLGAGEVVMVDSQVRAVRLAQANAARAGLACASALLREDLEDLPGAFDLALANPPYYGDFRIARSFVVAARRTLRPGGRLQLVAKAGAEHARIVEERFGEATVERRGGYAIVTAVRPD